MAVRCIQRNVRKFMSVRDWPWWRLLVRVTPLLNVHRTEEELRAKSEELEALRSKVDKLEAERTQLKHESDRLEAKVRRNPLRLAIIIVCFAASICLILLAPHHPLAVPVGLPALSARGGL
ncbi:hypothetical protein FOCC_FOCC017017, partial [Frankliniella occidentalis]